MPIQTYRVLIKNKKTKESLWITYVARDLLDVQETNKIAYPEYEILIINCL